MGIRLLEGSAGVHDKICLGALLGVAQLPPQDLVQLLRRHVRSLQHAGALHVCGRAADNYAIDAAFPPTLEQQRDLEHRKLGPRSGFAAKKIALRFEHQRMNNGLEPLELGGIREKELGETLAIHLPVGGGAWKCRLD